jgi:F-type H+-transporting ATPase subunit delta
MPNSKTTIGAKHVTRGLLSYLRKSNQLNLLPQVAREALKVSRGRLDPNTAFIESPVALSDTQTGDLTKALSAKFGRPLTVISKVNPNLIGGLLIKVGDRVIDQSLNEKINQLSQRINL